jgi:hypothetical protein
MKNCFLLTGLLLAVLLPACSPLEFEDYPQGTAAATPAGEADAGPDPQTDSRSQALPELSAHLDLLIGTFRLEGTDQEVTSDQAAALIPLWMTMKTTLANMLFTAEDLDAVTDQIQAVMTPDQLAAIDGMNLTYQDLTDTMGELNLSFGHWGGIDDLDDDDGPSHGESTPAAGEGTFPPEGTPQFPGSGDMNHWSQMIPPGMVDKLLEYLRGK